MTATTPSPMRASPIQLKHVALFLLALMALFVLFQRDLQLLDAGSPLRQRYAGISSLMLAHGIFGALALLMAPFQFSSRLRQRHIRVHRLMGRLYVLGVAVAAPVSIPVAVILGPPMLVMAATIQAVGWLLTTATALYCVRTGRIQQHREWMMRSYPFAMVFVIARVILGIPAIESMGEVAFVSVVWSVIATACFLPSFLIAWQGVLSARSASAGA
ncbi:MAG TPA: DUF2306 domain-containing protein [Stellaceae bacterium]|nr:DUF2306 domain-containing protein [Stellaceae bacterium]